MADVKMDLRYKVDVDAPLNVRTLQTLLAEGDREANRITIVLSRDGKPMNVDGMAVSGSMTRADGAEVGIDGYAAGNVVTAELNEYCYAVGGPFGLYVQLIGAEGVKRTILLLAGHVQERGHGEQIDTGKPIPSLDELMAQLETMRAVSEEAAKAAESAREASESASENAGAAEEAARYVGNTTVSAETLQPGSAPTVEKSTAGGHMHLTFGLAPGEKGEPGESYKIKGPAYATVEAMQAAVANPEEGDQYNVGAGAPYNVYRWTGSKWEDQGQLRGPNGFVFTPSVSDDGLLSWSNDGGLENPQSVNIRGEKGERGEPGPAYTIKGQAYATVEALQAAVTNPEEGDQYNVGTHPPYNIYRWTGGAWEDQGKLRGAQGATFTPSVSENGVLSWTNDGGLANPSSVNIKGDKGDRGEPGATGSPGAAGADGYTPVRGVDYWTESDIAAIKGYVDDAILNGSW